MITAITQYGKQAFIGCANGELVDLNMHATAPAALQTVFQDQSIVFLQLLNEHILVAAGENEFVVFTNLHYGICKRFPLLSNKVVRCFRLTSGRILIVFTSRAFWVCEEYKYSCMSMRLKRENIH